MFNVFWHFFSAKWVWKICWMNKNDIAKAKALHWLTHVDRTLPIVYLLEIKHDWLDHPPFSSMFPCKCPFKWGFHLPCLIGGHLASHYRDWRLRSTAKPEFHSSNSSALWATLSIWPGRNKKVEGITIFRKKSQGFHAYDLQNRHIAAIRLVTHVLLVVLRSTGAILRTVTWLRVGILES